MNLQSYKNNENKVPFYEIVFKKHFTLFKKEFSETALYFIFLYLCKFKLRKTEHNATVCRNS